MDDDWRGGDNPSVHQNFKTTPYIPGNDEMETRKTTALTTVITGLRKFTNYSLQVLAFTKVGDGVHTSTIYCQTDEDGKALPYIDVIPQLIRSV